MDTSSTINMKTSESQNKSSQNIANPDHSNYTPLEQIMKPIHYSMLIFGVYFELPQRAEDTEDDSVQRKGICKRTKESFVKLYCVCLTAIAAFNTLRYIPAFWVGLDFNPNVTVSRIVWLSWLLQCFLNRVFLLRAFWSQNRLPAYFRYFNNIMTDTCCVQINPACHKSRRYAKIAVILAWTLIILNNGISVFNIVTDHQPDFASGITNPFSADSWIATVFISSLIMFEAGPWLFPVLLQVTLFTILRNQFQSFTNILSKMAKEDNVLMLQKMKEIRFKHLQLCKAVGMLERDTKYLIAGNYVTNTFLTCFILYQIVTSGPLPWMNYASFSLWLVMNTFIMISVSVTAAMVSEEAHSALDYIFDVSVGGASRCEALELQLFLSKLNGPTIGFTVLGIITITKEMLFTLGGLILTYFFLLLQFNI